MRSWKAELSEIRGFISTSARGGLKKPQTGRPPLAPWTVQRWLGSCQGSVLAPPALATSALAWREPSRNLIRTITTTPHLWLGRLRKHPISCITARQDGPLGCNVSQKKGVICMDGGKFHAAATHQGFRREIYQTRSLGARLLGSGPSGRFWALRACLTSSFAPFGRSGRYVGPA